MQHGDALRNPITNICAVLSQSVMK